MKVVAAFAPVASLPFTQDVGFVFVVVDVEVETNGHLPADFWLPIDEVLASGLSCRMERAASSTGKTGAVEEDASAFMAASDPISMVFMDGPSEACCYLFELPFVIAKAREDFSDTLSVLFV
jgi:hypothetical protein